MGFPFFALRKKKNPKAAISRSSSDASSSSDDSSSGSSSPHSVLRRRAPDGRIPRDDLAAALRRLHHASDEVDAVLSEVDRHGDGLVRIEDVCAGGGGEEEDQIRAAFSAYDLDADGRISAEDLREMMVRLGDDRCSLEECRRMVAVVDGDGDGFVGFGDFARMMTSSSSSSSMFY